MWVFLYVNTKKLSVSTESFFDYRGENYEKEMLSAESQQQGFTKNSPTLFEVISSRVKGEFFGKVNLMPNT